MRILLDENTPRGVRRILTGHDIRTAPEMGWGAYSNGLLLDEVEKAGFDALVTCNLRSPLGPSLALRGSTAGRYASILENSQAPIASRIAARRPRTAKSVAAPNTKPPPLSAPRRPSTP